MLRDNQLGTLRSIERKLRKLQEVSKRDRDTRFFDNYFSHYNRYKKLYSKANPLIDNEELKEFELKIVRLSEKEIDDLASKGKHDAILGANLLRISNYSRNLASYLAKYIVNHENVLKAKAYLDDAYNEKSRAYALIEKRDWNGSVESSQHCIEHAIKSLFRLVGVEHPFEHDPTKKFEAVVEKLKGLPKWELKNLARVRWIAKVWATIHEESMYAFHNIPAKDFFNDRDAKVLKDYAEAVYNICQRLVRMVEFKEFKIQE